MKSAKSKSKVLTIEDEITIAAFKNGSAFVQEPTSGNEYGAAVVAEGVAVAVQRAISLNLLTDEEKARTKCEADRLRAEQEKRRAALEREEAELKAELADIEAKEGE